MFHRAALHYVRKEGKARATLVRDLALMPGSSREFRDTTARVTVVRLFSINRLGLTAQGISQACSRRVHRTFDSFPCGKNFISVIRMSDVILEKVFQKSPVFDLQRRVVGALSKTAIRFLTHVGIVRTSCLLSDSEKRTVSYSAFGAASIGGSMKPTRLRELRIQVPTGLSEPMNSPQGS